ncbi:hypothetical protein CPC08DRAFT_103391 [Agrocybe pediades]|nr:hypothetical protein CPC08DRAFT_103391 [Agrocybe pediades]
MLSTTSTTTSSSAAVNGPFIKQMLEKLIGSLHYRQERPLDDDNVLYEALKAEFAEFDTGAWFDRLCRVLTFLISASIC